MAIVRCQSCAAPLHPQAGETHLKCGYCGSTTALAQRRWGSGSVAGASAGRGTVLFIVIGLFVTVGAGAAVFMRAGGIPGLSLSEWYGSGCPIDANGDDTLDMIGRTAMPGGMSHSLTVLDGKTGTKLWSSESTYSHETTLMCLGADHFAIAYPDFRVELWGSKSQAPSATLRLSDAVRSWGRQDGCAVFETADGDTFVDLVSSKVADCVPAPEERHPLHHAAGFFTRDDEASLTHKGTTYSVIAKEKGTPLLTVRATQGETLKWEMKLALKKVDSSGVHLALSDDAVFTYGVKAGDDDYGVLVALEMSDGRVRFQARQSSSWSSNFARTFIYNGHSLIVTWGFGVHAYDPQSGERVWALGGR